MSAKTMNAYSFLIDFGRQLSPEPTCMFGIYRLYLPPMLIGSELAQSVEERVEV